MRPGLLCAVVAAAALAATAAAPAGAASCSRTQAKAAVAKVKPHIRSLANTPIVVTPAMIDEILGRAREWADRIGWTVDRRH